MKNMLRLSSIFVSAFFLLVGCMGNDAHRIKIDGSATVLPITQAVVEEFSQDNHDTEISISAAGTGGGFKKFVNNEIDIQNASRQIHNSELEVAKQHNVSYYELPIAKDAIVVAVNKANSWATDFTTEQLYNIFIADSKIKTWSDINPNWPSEKINFYVPALDSGTFDYFHGKIMQGTAEIRMDATSSQDLNVLVTGVEGDKNALGFFSYAYYQSAFNKVHALSINNVAPDQSQIISNQYPLTRNLFIYVNKNKFEAKPVLQQFVEYYMQHAGKFAEEVGFIPLTIEEYQKASRLLTRF